MPASTPVNPDQPGLEITTWFVRHRNVLLARAELSPLFVDFYLHLADQAITVAPEHAELFKRALAVYVLHAASRPWNELTAWTMNFQSPLLNVFITGDNEDGSVVGRVFADNVRTAPHNLFFADVVRGRQPKRRSSVEFTGADPLAAVEAYYRQSEQRPARAFQLGEDEFALVSAHPDYNEAWFDALTPASVAALGHGKDATTVTATGSELGKLETRVYRWHCGCNQARMLEVLAPIYRQDPAELFADGENIELRCPRCAARHRITREALEAFVSAT